MRYFRPARIRVRHPQAGRITLELFQLRLEDDPGLLMVMQVPADSASRDRVAALLAGPPTLSAGLQVVSLDMHSARSASSL